MNEVQVLGELFREKTSNKSKLTTFRRFGYSCCYYRIGGNFWKVLIILVIKKGSSFGDKPFNLGWRMGT